MLGRKNGTLTWAFAVKSLVLGSLTDPADSGNPFRYTRNPLQAFCAAPPNPLEFQRSWDLRTTPTRARAGACASYCAGSRRGNHIGS